MKVEYLRYFLAAASEGSFSEAGSKMHISPSSIGYAIDKLEEQLNTNLFVRIPSKGLSLTPDGIILQENAIKILAEYTPPRIEIVVLVASTAKDGDRKYPYPITSFLKVIPQEELEEKERLNRELRNW